MPVAPTAHHGNRRASQQIGGCPVAWAGEQDGIAHEAVLGLARRVTTIGRVDVIGKGPRSAVLECLRYRAGGNARRVAPDWTTALGYDV